MAYRAEIEISVKGARQLREVTSQIEELAERVDLVSANFKPFIQTLGQFESNLSRTATTLKRVRAGADDEVTAIKQYVQALGQANAARARQNDLIQQELALQEATKRKTQPGQTGFSRAQYGPALPPALIKQQEDQQNFKRLFAELNETAKVISVSNTNTETSWQRTFKELNETAKVIAVSRLNTETSWQRTFKELNETAKAISVSRLNTQASWQRTFKELNETAKVIAVSRLNTQASWQRTFKELNETAKVIAVSRLNTQASWQRTFKELNETAKVIAVSRLNVKSSWIKALSDLEEVATDISKAAERERRQTRNRARRGTVSAGRERQARTRDATSNAIIGGAFPLLFGQGIGASVGGAVGGAGGGLLGGQFGFGLSLVGTAVGSAVDTLIAETQELAKALNSTGSAFDLLTEKNLFSSKETELLANQLAELGEVGKLAALVTEELVGIIGNKGVESLQTLGDTTDETTRLWNALTLQLQKLVAGPLNAFLSLVNKALGAQVQLGQFNSIIEENPAAKARYQELIGARRGRDAAKNGMSQAEARAQVLKEFPPVVTAQIPVTVEDRKRFTPPKTRADRGAERANLEEERLQQRLAFLRIELNLIEDNANFKTLITAAEIAGNKELAIRLKAQQTINTIQANEEKALIRIEDTRVKSLVKQETAAKKNAANVNAAAELAVFEDQKQKAFNEQIESLNFQYEILTATTVEEQKRLEIAQQMAALEGKNYTPEQLDQIQAAKEKLDIGPIAKYVNELQRSLSDTESMVVSLAQSIESSLATAMSSAVQSIVTGTGSVQEAFSGMFANIGKAFIDMATQMIAKALIMKAVGILTSAFGGGGSSPGIQRALDVTPQTGAAATSALTNFLAPRANGGPVSANQPYVVGERGPELFVPGSAGTVLSNSQSRASMDRYSGGNARGGSVSVNYNVTDINNMRFVTEDQFRAGVAQAAKQGANGGFNRTMSSLKNNRSTRSRIGV